MKSILFAVAVLIGLAVFPEKAEARFFAFNRGFNRGFNAGVRASNFNHVGFNRGFGSYGFNNFNRFGFGYGGYSNFGFAGYGYNAAVFAAPVYAYPTVATYAYPAPAVYAAPVTYAAPQPTLVEETTTTTVRRFAQ